VCESNRETLGKTANNVVREVGHKRTLSWELVFQLVLTCKAPAFVPSMVFSWGVFGCGQHDAGRQVDMLGFGSNVRCSI
jgi:hypothetical protein